MSYISATLRRSVCQRAREACEYCLFPQAASLFSLEIEHIIVEKHDGLTELIRPGSSPFIRSHWSFRNAYRFADMPRLIHLSYNSLTHN
jgi:hypothetical protein